MRNEARRGMDRSVKGSIKPVKITEDIDTRAIDIMEAFGL